MVTMDSTFDKTASETIDLLDERLQRIEYVLFGEQDVSTMKEKKPATRQLHDLERALDQLVSKSRVMQDLLKLHAHHPSLFEDPSTNESPLFLDDSLKLSTILSSASAYHTTASCLTSINDTPIPSAEASAQLIATETLAARVALRQQIQAREIRELKARSAVVLKAWYEEGVLEQGERWAGVERRVVDVERVVRRVEGERRREKEGS